MHDRDPADDVTVIGALCWLLGVIVGVLGTLAFLNVTAYLN